MRGNAGEGARLHTEPGEATGAQRVSHTVEPSTAITCVASPSAVT